ncbi:hypothetical protein NGM10_06815 [Halorussus salilacus]|uniref:hypothetical protein n=1 Tax=Halorussus salilacus TaxID=2953750 RepID=UPI00209F1514|nr:hypothetical protein [Halorussus salilacus]USZ69439.1 hypothetical protein NGM10_06815 [Halorussus salilacus]
MRRLTAAIALALLVSLAGCSGAVGDPFAADETDAAAGDVVTATDASANATGVDHTLRVEANESTAGSELESVSATYPREAFEVEGAKHGAVELGVDTDGDGDAEREFNESHVSGVNNNEYSFTVELDTGYALDRGDAVVVTYPAVDNPDESGEYEVAVTLNDDQTENGTLAVEA